MRSQDVILQALLGIRRHKSRAILILVELVVGVAAVTIVLNVAGALALQQSNMARGFDSQVIALELMRQDTLDRGREAFLRGAQLDPADLVERCSAIEAATKVQHVLHAPMPSSGRGGRQGGDAATGYALRVDASFGKVFRPKMLVGSWFTASDEKSATPVIVVTAKMAKAFFGRANPLGQELTLPMGRGSNRTLVVAGVLDPAFRFPYHGMVPNWTGIEESLAFVPDWGLPETVGNQAAVSAGSERYWARARSEGAVGDAVEQLSACLRPLPEEIAYRVKPAIDLIAERHKDTSWLVTLVNLFAWSVLIIAGLGLCGVMFIVVRERMSEIGIRSALGATPGQVTAQVLVEVVCLSCTGGLGGIAVAAAVLGLVPPDDIPKMAGIATYLKAAGLSVGIGVAAGCWPAVQAGRMNPLDALARRL